MNTYHTYLPRWLGSGWWDAQEEVISGRGLCEERQVHGRGSGLEVEEEQPTETKHDDERLVCRRGNATTSPDKGGHTTRAVALDCESLSI